jgi:2-C-methyl-D-erythritol 4-phosphate cytidylyltransferase
VDAVLYSAHGASSPKTPIPREMLFRTQTPHTYKLDQLLWAHAEAEKRGITNTAASCTLMNQLGEPVYFSKGSETNIKITTRDDLLIFTALLHSSDTSWSKHII